MHRSYQSPSIGRSRVAGVVLALLAWLFASPGYAAPLYEVDLQATANSGGVFVGDTPGLSDSSPVSLFELRNVDITTGFASAAAGPGSVAVVGTSTYIVTDVNSNTDATGIATAISTIDDVIFSGSGFLNNVFLNLDLSGFMAASGAADVAQSTLQMTIRLNNQTLTGFRTVQVPSFFADEEQLDGVWPAGQPAFDGTIAVGPFDFVPTGVPVILRIGANIFTSVFLGSGSPNPGVSASGIGNLGSTLSFTNSGDLFSGVPGSVDSVQGSIAGNLWTGSPVSAPPAPVPLPPALALAGFGVSALFACGRRRRPVKGIGDVMIRLRVERRFSAHLPGTRCQKARVEL
jgi:hypothetical protein